MPGDRGRREALCLSGSVGRETPRLTPFAKQGIVLRDAIARSAALSDVFT